MALGVENDVFLDIEDEHLEARQAASQGPAKRQAVGESAAQFREMLIDSIKSNLDSARRIRLLWAATLLSFAMPTASPLIKTLTRTLDAYHRATKGKSQHGQGPPWWQLRFQMIKYLSSIKLSNQSLHSAQAQVIQMRDHITKPSLVFDICAMMIVREQRSEGSQLTNIVLQVFPEHRVTFQAVQTLLTSECEAQRLPGSPPPSPLERRLQEHLKSLGVHDRLETKH